MRRLAITLAAFSALVATAIAAETITTIAGEGTLTTRPFETPGPWVIQWTADQDITIYVWSRIDGTPAVIGVGAADLDGGAGESYQAAGGEFWLQIVSLGAWSIDIAPAE